MELMQVLKRGKKIGQPLWCLKTEFGDVVGPFERNSDGYSNLVRTFNKFPTCLVDIHECWIASKGRFIVSEKRYCDITGLICSRIFAKVTTYKKRRKNTDRICNMVRKDGVNWGGLNFNE
jgi:hypothetical protein